MLKFPDVKYYKTDLTGVNPDNKVTLELHERTADSKDVIFLPRQGHFFHKNFKMFDAKGKELDKGVHYEFYDISRSLTGFVKNATVGLFVKLLDTTLTEWYCTYQVVGNFSIIDRDFASKILSALNDDRPVYFKDIKNMLKWFAPMLHQHDIRYEIHSFKDLIDQIMRIELVYGVLPDRETVSIDHFYKTISFYIDDFKKRLKEAVTAHDNAKGEPYPNAHGLTAKKVALEKVDNFKTATYIQILEGIEVQLHITADLTKQVVAQYAKESDHLIHKGVLPIIRYGNNNFIPPSISGSFEGMGGTNFTVGLNTESDGTTLLLGNRSDGKVDGLYFMRNTDSNLDPTKWEFTAFRYVHPRATSDGVSLRFVVRGSSGKALIVHDDSKFYWALGNDTFDPNRHVLNTFPQAMYDEGMFSSAEQLYLVTVGAPDKILLFKAMTHAEVWNNDEYRGIAWDLPGGTTSATNFSPVTDYRSTSINVNKGMTCWELDIPSQTWRPVVFNYTQVGKTLQISSRLYCPFKYVIENTTYIDGTVGYGLTQGFGKYKWPVKTHKTFQLQSFVGKYDNVKKTMAIKYIFDSRIDDIRGHSSTIGVNSIGFALENPTITNGNRVYTVRKGKMLGSVPALDNELVAVPKGVPADWAELYQIRNTSSYSLVLKNDKYFVISVGTYGGYPCQISSVNLANDSAFLSYEQFFTKAFAGTTKYAEHNETNPLGLAISPTCDAWLLPTLTNVNTYGAIFTSLPDGSDTRYKLAYRRMDAMNADKSIKAPYTSYTLYGAAVKGYPLSNDVRMVDADPYLPINTYYFQPNEPNFNAYSMMRFSHHTVPIPLTGAWNNNTANQLYPSEATVDMGPIIKFTPTKRLNLGTVMDNVIIPHFKTWADTNGFSGDLANIKTNYMLFPATLRGGNTDMFLYVAVGMTPERQMRLVAQLITLTGGSYDVNGLRTPTGATFIGNVMTALDTIIASETDLPQRTEGSNQRIVQDYLNHAPLRPVIAQQPDGSTMVFSDCPRLITPSSGYHRTGFLALYTLSGLTKFDYKPNDRTNTGQPYSPHPYYQILRKNANYIKGAAIIGQGLLQASDNNYANMMANALTAGYVMNISNYIEGAFSVYFKSAEKVIFGGAEYTLPVRVIDLYDVDPAPANKKFYCYLTYSNGEVQYKIEPTPLADSYSCALLATIQTNSNGITQILPTNVFTMNGFRIGIDRHGSTVPAATGVITTAGQTAGWADNSEDLS